MNAYNSETNAADSENNAYNYYFCSLNPTDSDC